MAGSRNKGVTRREDERGIEQGRPGGSARVLPTLSQSRRIYGASCQFTVCRICSLSFLGCIIDFGRRVHVTGGGGV